MNQEEFYKTLGILLGQGQEEFVYVAERLIDLLDQTDGEDFFGTEGWRHILGWDE